MQDSREEVFSERKERLEGADVLSMRRSRRVLTQEGLEAMQAEARGELTVAETGETVVEVPDEPAGGTSDPSVALRHAKLGVFAVLTLVLLLMWIAQRRKEG